MRTLKSLVVVSVTILALSILAPTVAAGSPKAFHLTKTCSSDVLCTIVSDSFAPIGPGTDVTYVNSDPWNGLAYPSIAIAHGSTTGVCDWNQPGPDVLAICTFASGSGRLHQFHLVVDVSVDANGLWYWDGWYWFGR